MWLHVSIATAVRFEVAWDVHIHVCSVAARCIWQYHWSLLCMCFSKQSETGQQLWSYIWQGRSGVSHDWRDIQQQDAPSLEIPDEPKGNWGPSLVDTRISYVLRTTLWRHAPRTQSASTLIAARVHYSWCTRPCRVSRTAQLSELQYNQRRKSLHSPCCLHQLGPAGTW